MNLLGLEGWPHTAPSRLPASFVQGLHHLTDAASPFQAGLSSRRALLAHGGYFASLTTNDVERIFIYLLSVYVSSLEKCLFSPGQCGSVSWSVVCNGKVVGLILSQGT